MRDKNFANSCNLLRDKELYVLDSSDSADQHIVYAPLADSAFIADNADINALAHAIVSPADSTPEYLQTIEDLTDIIPVCDRDGYIRSEKDFINLSILPNNICNFSCSYCYSAKGRSTAHLDFPTVKTILDYFFTMARTSEPPLLTVSIFGGGEPMLSWESVVEPTINYICTRKSDYTKVVITLITNGSIINERIIEKCKNCNIDLVVSFDILEDVQNSQRRHFKEVSANIQKMIDNGVVPAINSVVTELNVQRQVAMIEELHTLYPDIKYVSFEPVIGEVDDKYAFYKQLAKGFVDAYELAESYGMKLSCSTFRNIDVSVDRYCAGEFALCPDSSISICPCVSSSQEANYGKYIYGRVEDDRVIIDSRKLQSLLSANVHSNQWCRHCFAKWNCGGGCMNTTLANGGRQDVEYCKYTRSLTKYFLYKRLADSYRNEYDEDITKYIDLNEYTI